ncbi:MbtH family protein [Streptomyces sp. NPDC004788]
MQDAGVDERFVVVVNDEEQYSLWAEQRELPAGWRTAGFAGTKAECLAHVEEVWTDQRPLSVRRNAAA